MKMRFVGYSTLCWLCLAGVVAVMSAATPPAFAPAAQAAGDTPEVPEAKAVITLADGRPVPETWPLGFSIPLSAIKSTAGDLEKSVRWTVEPAAFDTFCQRTDRGRGLTAQTGVVPVTLRITLQVAKGDTFDATTIVIRSDRPLTPEPGPGPPPTPTPVPDPAPGPPPGPTPGPKPAPEPDSASVVPEIRKAAADYFKDYTVRFSGDSAVIAASSPRFNDLMQAQQVRRKELGDKLGALLNAQVYPLVDQKSGLFTDKAKASEVFWRIANSLQAGIRDAAR